MTANPAPVSTGMRLKIKDLTTLLLIKNGYPVIADRTPWFQDEELKKLR